MSEYTFEIKKINGENGKVYTILTANEYPWMNVQIIQTPPELRQKILEDLERKHYRVTFALGRTDFCAIQAGGGSDEHPTIPINQSNYEQVGKALLSCQQAATVFWAVYSGSNETD